MPYKANVYLIRSVLDWYQEGITKVVLFWASKTIDDTIIISMQNLRLAGTLVSLCSIFDTVEIPTLQI